MRTRIIPIFLAVALTASAQRFTFGVKAGAPVTSAHPNEDSAPYSMVDTGRWTVGPTAEVRLFGNLSFEGDALFRGYRYEQSSGFNAIPSGAGLTNINSVVPIFSSFRQDAKEWDIPLLLKYRLHAGPLRPFVDAGFEFAHVSSDFTSSTTCLGTADACNASGLTAFFYPSASYHSSVNRRGPAAGVGLEFKYGRLRIAPEVRYTRLDRPNANEVTVMAGFTF